MHTLPDLSGLFKGTLTLAGWEKHTVRDNYAYGGTSIPALRQEVYKREVDGALLSVGVFYYNNTLAYVAWGFEDAALCSMHATLSPQGALVETRVGCPEVAPILDGEEVVGFVLDGKERWELKEV